jgi:hypothetical protein
MTRIVQVRLSGAPEDVTAFAAMLAAIPQVTATPPGLRRNREDPGVRGYLTVTFEDQERTTSGSTHP